MNEKKEVQEIDLMELFEVLLGRWVMIVIAAIVGGVLALAGTLTLVTPKYQSSAMLYVNNSSLDVGSTKIDLSDLTASKNLVNTYTVILKSRTTLQLVIDRLGLDYTTDQLSKMISTVNVNDTEVFSVTVTDSDPDEAELIANCIVEVLPNRINTIMEGSNVKIVDTAVADYDIVSPNYRKNTMVGLLLGIMLVSALIIVRHLLDTTIHSEEFLLKEYPDLPLLSVVPVVGDTPDK